MSGQFPFFGADDEEYYQHVLTQDLEFPEAEWASINPDAIDLIKGLLEKDPEKRMRPEEALRHKWLADASTSNVAVEDIDVLKLQKADEDVAPKTFRFGKKKSPGEILARIEAANNGQARRLSSRLSRNKK